MTVIRRALVQDAPVIARIHIETWITSFEHILTPEQVKLKDLDFDSQTQLWTKRLTTEENQTRYTLVAENDAAEIIGYTTGCKNETDVADYAAELHQIYIATEGQRQGIGGKLVHQLARTLSEAGYESLIVWVVPENPAVDFYRDYLGGQFITERIIPDADGVLKEAAYGWKDIVKLFEADGS